MDDSPLQKVELQTDVYMVCLQHALSTENFEVMGLLIGNVCWIILTFLTFFSHTFLINETSRILITRVLVCLWNC